MLKPGDIVTVRGNTNPRMTVEKCYNNAKQTQCVWFDKENKLHRDWFQTEVLYCERLSK